MTRVEEENLTGLCPSRRRIWFRKAYSDDFDLSQERLAPFMKGPDLGSSSVTRLYFPDSNVVSSLTLLHAVRDEKKENDLYVLEFLFVTIDFSLTVFVLQSDSKYRVSNYT